MFARCNIFTNFGLRVKMGRLYGTSKKGVQKMFNVGGIYPWVNRLNYWSLLAIWSMKMSKKVYE